MLLGIGMNVHTPHTRMVLTASELLVCVFNTQTFKRTHAHILNTCILDRCVPLKCGFKLLSQC